VVCISETLKKIIGNFARLTNKLHHITVLKNVHFTIVINIYNSGNSRVLQSVLTERTRLSVLVFTSLRARSVIKAIKINFATICFISHLAQQINFSVHRTLENTLSARITTLIDSETNNLAALHSKGDNLMLKTIITEFRCNRFSEVLQNRDTSWYQAPMLVALIVAEDRGGVKQRTRLSIKKKPAFLRVLGDIIFLLAVEYPSWLHPQAFSYTFLLNFDLFFQ